MIMQNQLALIKRELWEHRSVYVVPAAIGIIMILATLTGQVGVSAYGAAVDVGLMSIAELGEAERRALGTGYLVGLSILFVISMWVLAVFYSLDSLYAERKDKSILFWRSLPVTDAETVVSKLLVALIAIPLATFVGIVVTHIISLIVSSIWVQMEGGNALHIVWGSMPLFDAWVAILIFMIAMMIWLSPFVGWFLLVSAWTKRSPLLVASMPFVVLPMLERIVFGSYFFVSIFFERTVKLPLFGVGAEQKLDNIFELEELQLRPEQISLLDIIDLPQFLLHPSLWGGIIVCAGFTAGAIWIRRYRDES